MELNTLVDLCARRQFIGLRGGVLKIEAEFYLSNLQYTRVHAPRHTQNKREIWNYKFLNIN